MATTPKGRSISVHRVGVPRWLFVFAVWLLLSSALSNVPHVTTLDPDEYYDLEIGLTDNNKTSGSPAEGPPDVHRIGILQPLSDEHTTDILSLLDSPTDVFHIVSISNPSSHKIDGYREAVQEVRDQDISALIGPFVPQYSVACQHLRIPYLVTSQLPKDLQSDPFFIELFPNEGVFARSVLDVLKFYGFKKLAVIYDTKSGASILETLAGQPWLEVVALKVMGNDTREVRNTIKSMRENYFVNYVSILSAEMTSYVMNQALSLSMFSAPFKWILVNTRLQEFSLTKYVDSRANITVIRLMMDYDSRSCALQSDKINLKRAILHDAVQVYLTQLAQRAAMVRFSMRRTISMVEVDGCTGHLNFTRLGRRRESFLQLMTLQGYRTGRVNDEDFRIILDVTMPEKDNSRQDDTDLRTWCQRLSGTWRSAPSELGQRVVPSRSYSGVVRLGENVFGDEPIRITTLIEAPFVQWRDESQTNKWREEGVVEATTGKHLEGLCVDILKEMSRLLDFTFNVSLVPDGKFGSDKGAERGWTGMVRELMDDKADIALAPFQMSAERSSVVDFTKPFMIKGTTLLVRRPEQHFWIFQFLSPLSNVVWCAIFFAFVIVSLVLFGVSRVNSDCQAKRTSNLRESLWYIWGTLLRGSLNGSPHAISSRIVSSAWWFFCLIVTSIYTANLAAFLTITIGDAGITSAADLARQDYYDYGTVEGSQTETFFKHTRMPDYQKMWAHMSTLHPDSIVGRVEDGFKRVRQGRYAFIWDSPTIQHEISNDCDLMEIGAPFDNKGYGFAFQKQAPYSERLSWALLKLNDAGILYRLTRKWWRPQFCPNHRQSAKTESLNLDTVFGMYLVLLAGIGLSIVLCLLQLAYTRCYKRPKKQRQKAPEEQEPTTKRDLEPWLKPAADGDGIGPAAESLQVYANHSPHAGFRSLTSADWSS